MRKSCSKTNQIKPLQSSETFFAKRASFLWQDTIISLAKTLDRDGRKCIAVRLEGVRAAVSSSQVNTATWIILSEDSAPNDAGASTTSDGSAPIATENDTLG
jgi:hypothetical protein